jgi:hypothetical protein
MPTPTPTPSSSSTGPSIHGSTQASSPWNPASSPTNTSTRCPGGSDELKGPIGEFLLQLLIVYDEAECFFKAGSKAAVEEALKKAEARVEILKGYQQVKEDEITVSGQFRRFLADRSLAISCEEHMAELSGGSVPAFVRSIRHIVQGDQQVVVDAVYRGQKYRKFEALCQVEDSRTGEMSATPGISAVACFAYRYFKAVPSERLDSCFSLLRTEKFQKIVDLGVRLSPMIEESQRIFHRKLGIKTKQDETGQGKLVLNECRRSLKEYSVDV